MVIKVWSNNNVTLELAGILIAVGFSGNKEATFTPVAFLNFLNLWGTDSIWGNAEGTNLHELPASSPTVSLGIPGKIISAFFQFWSLKEFFSQSIILFAISTFSLGPAT